MVASPIKLNINSINKVYDLWGDPIYVQIGGIVFLLKGITLKTVGEFCGEKQNFSI